MIQFTYEFSEAALIREPGMVAGLVGGEADIGVTDETTGEWTIRAIRLDGALASKPDVCLHPVAELDRDSWLFTVISAELESEFKSAIEDRVAAELGELAMEGV